MGLWQKLLQNLFILEIIVLKYFLNLVLCCLSCLMSWSWKFLWKNVILTFALKQTVFFTFTFLSLLQVLLGSEGWETFNLLEWSTTSLCRFYIHFWILVRIITQDFSILFPLPFECENIFSTLILKRFFIDVSFFDLFFNSVTSRSNGFIKLIYIIEVSFQFLLWIIFERIKNLRWEIA